MIDSVASHGESTPRVITQTQALPPAAPNEDLMVAVPLADTTTQLLSQAVLSVDVGEDPIVVPNPASNLIQREYISRYVKDYPTIKRGTVLVGWNPGSCLPCAAGNEFQTSVRKLKR
jgi:hypothetical protein